MSLSGKGNYDGPQKLKAFEKQVIKVIWQMPPRIGGESRGSRLILCFLGPNNIHPVQELDPFSHICTAEVA